MMSPELLNINFFVVRKGLGTYDTNLFIRILYLGHNMRPSPLYNRTCDVRENTRHA